MSVSHDAQLLVSECDIKSVTLGRTPENNDKHCICNKCIGDDTKAAARQSPICIKKTKNKI